MRARALLVSLLMVGTACGATDLGDATATVTVFAAASLTEAFTQIADDYAELHGIEVRLSFGPSDGLATQIDEYFDGSRPDFDLPLDIDTGSDFQRRIWQTIADIPRGEVLSYAEVAMRAGFPNAFRAVGSACGANPVALVVPCHRVVASGGRLGGYGGGLDMKVWLLRHEGFVCSAVRPDATVKRGSLLGI